MSTNTETQLQYRIDSSDDERETRVQDVALDRESYINGLVRDINPAYDDSQHKQLVLRCGLILHHYADRLFNRGDIRTEYQKQEKELLDLGERGKETAVVEIKKLLTQTQKSINNPFNEGVNINTLDPKTVEQIFNYAFNDKVDKPTSLQEGVTKASLFSAFKEVYQASTDIDLGFLHRHQQLTINIEPRDDSTSSPSMFPVSAELIRRSARDLSKEVQLVGRDRESTAIINIGQVAGSTVRCIAHKSGNIQLANLVGFGQYKDEHLNLVEHAKDISDLIKSGQIPERLSRKEQTFVSEAACVMGVAEVVRSKAAIFTTPMFLDMLQQQQSTTSHMDFPMSAERAVDMVRGVYAEYENLLPNARTMDKITARTGEHNVMLIKEGEMLAKWAAQKECHQLANLLSALAFVDELQKAPDAIDRSKYKELSSKLAYAYQGNTSAFNTIGLTEEFVDSVKTKASAISDRARGDIEGKAKDVYAKLRMKSAELQELYTPHKVSELLHVALHEAIGAIDQHILHVYYHINPNNIFPHRERQAPALEVSAVEREAAIISVATNTNTPIGFDSAHGHGVATSSVLEGAVALGRVMIAHSSQHGASHSPHLSKPEELRSPFPLSEENTATQKGEGFVSKRVKKEPRR